MRYDFAVNGKFSVNLIESDYNFLLCTLPATISEYSNESRLPSEPYTIRIVENIQTPHIKIDYKISYKTQNESSLLVKERDTVLLNIIDGMRNMTFKMDKTEIDNFDQERLKNASINLALQYTNPRIQIQIESMGWVSLEVQ